MPSLYTCKSWKKFRESIFRRDGHTCADCGRTPADGVVLQAHHKFYRPGLLPWEAQTSEVVTLCKGCHASAHGITRPTIGWDQISWDDLGDLTGKCDLCGNAIRYVFTVFHPRWSPLEVGEICCDHLTDTKLATFHMRSFIGKRRRKAKFFESSKWEEMENGSLVADQAGFSIEISGPPNNYFIIVNGVQGRKIYASRDCAQEKLFSLIDEGTISNYFARRQQRNIIRLGELRQESSVHIHDMVGKSLIPSKHR